MLQERCSVHADGSAKQSQPLSEPAYSSCSFAMICKPCFVEQEVQSNHFDNFLAPELQKAGYTAIYKRKTTELYTGTSYAIDGCATFFKRDKFALVKKYEVWSDLHIMQGGAMQISAMRCNIGNAIRGARSYVCSVNLSCFMCKQKYVAGLVGCKTAMCWHRNAYLQSVHTAKANSCCQCNA